MLTLCKVVPKGFQLRDLALVLEFGLRESKEPAMHTDQFQVQDIF